MGVFLVVSCMQHFSALPLSIATPAHLSTTRTEMKNRTLPALSEDKIFAHHRQTSLYSHQTNTCLQNKNGQQRLLCHEESEGISGLLSLGTQVIVFPQQHLSQQQSFHQYAPIHSQTHQLQSPPSQWQQFNHNPLSQNKSHESNNHSNGLFTSRTLPPLSSLGPSRPNGDRTYLPSIWVGSK